MLHIIINKYICVIYTQLKLGVYKDTSVEIPSHRYVLHVRRTLYVVMVNWAYGVRCILYVLQYTSYSVRRTLYAMQCMSYSIRHTVYVVQCMSYSIRRTVYVVQCTSYIIRHAVYVVQYTSYSVRRTVYAIQCTSYSVRHTLYVVYLTPYNSMTCHRGYLPCRVEIATLLRNRVMAKLYTSLDYSGIRLIRI